MNTPRARERNVKTQMQRRNKNQKPMDQNCKMQKGITILLSESRKRQKEDEFTVGRLEKEGNTGRDKYCSYKSYGTKSKSPDRSGFQSGVNSSRGSISTEHSKNPVRSRY
jgi:hypothetical protein